MSQYYNPRRTKNLYSPTDKEPFKLSRSKIDQFQKCRRCFYLDRRIGVAQPPGFPFNLNSAVDLLLKKEFDVHRDGKTTHPLMETYGIKAVPFQHKLMDAWRDPFIGIQHHHEETNFIIFGGVDDIWENDKGELVVVDYKATSKDGEVSLDAEWQDGYRRQVEVYQWLLRKNGFKVSDTAYFVYANGMRDRKAFDGKLEFDVVILPHEGNDSWIDDLLPEIKKCLDNDAIPVHSPDCDHCLYRKAAMELQQEHLKRYPAKKKA